MDGAERVKLRAEVVALEEGMGAEDEEVGELRAGMFELESEDLRDGLTMVPLDLRMMGLEGERMGVEAPEAGRKAEYDCCC